MRSILTFIVLITVSSISLGETMQELREKIWKLDQYSYDMDHLNESTSHTYVEMTNEEKSRSKACIAKIYQRLKDPESAKFTEPIVFFMPQPSGAVNEYYQVKVNGKNSFGAYSGYVGAQCRFFSKEKELRLDFINTN